MPFNDLDNSFVAIDPDTTLPGEPVTSSGGLASYSENPEAFFAMLKRPISTMEYRTNLPYNIGDTIWDGDIVNPRLLFSKINGNINNPLPGGDENAFWKVYAINWGLPNAEFRIPSFGGGINVITLTASTTYVPSPGVKTATFIATGPGGGAGAASGTDDGATFSTAGSAGATAIKTVSSPSGNYAIVIGLGGAGGTFTDDDGQNGSASTNVDGSGILINAGVGLGGFGSVGSTLPRFFNPRSPSVATGGDRNLDGGSSTLSSAHDGDVGNVSISGASYWGSGGDSNVNNGDDINAKNPGSGGGVVAVFRDDKDFTGGPGADGTVEITEYF